jgi:hypothetical protein
MSWIGGTSKLPTYRAAGIICLREVLLNFASFRQVPTFARDTIRRFGRNVSELKKMAARDYEDMLQVGRDISN